MDTTKKMPRVIEATIALTLVLLLIVVAGIKLASKDIYRMNATVFQTARMALYAAAAVCAAVGLAVFAVGKTRKPSLPYGFLALGCLCMAFVQGLSIAGEFENQGKTLQDGMYAIVYLMLAATLYILCAMESPKKVFRLIVIVFSVVLFAAAMGTDFGYLMGKAGRITNETEGHVAFVLYADKIAVFLVGAAAAVYEVIGFGKGKTTRVEVTTGEGEE